MKKNKRLLKVFSIVFALALIITATGYAMSGSLDTGAWLSDNESSTGNTLTAGKLDLTVDGVNTNVVKFNVNPFVPGNQPNVTYQLKNEGNITGYLDLQSVTFVDYENDLIDPETEAGDITTDVGELSGIVGIRIMNDINGDGWLQTGDTIIYDGPISGLASAYDSNITIPAGGTLHLNVLINWWSTANDNLAQTDSTVIGMTFELAQTTAQ